MLGLAALGVGAREAGARGGGLPPRPPVPRGREEPMGSPIHDVATTLSVPLVDDRRLVIGLTERFWVQCPRHSVSPASLEGEGVIAQYMNLRAGTVSMLYAGVVPLLPSSGGEAPEARAQRTVTDFLSTLTEKYARVDWTLTGGPVTAAPVTFKLDGKKAAAWRTKRYDSHPASAYGGPRSAFVGECLFFLPPGVDRLAYVALDAKAGGTTLDKVTEQLSVRPAAAVNPGGRRVQLNDLAEAADTSRFPVRQIAFDVPAGFLMAPREGAPTGEWVYLEERRDDRGRVDAHLRIEQHAADPARSLAQDLEAERQPWKDAERGPSEEVPLAVEGKTAWVFSHPWLRDGLTARAHAAVLRVDDQTLVITWISLGDPAQVDADRAALVRLVRSLDYAIRW